MLVKHLFKKPLRLIAYIIFMVLVPNLSVSLTYCTAMLIEHARQLDAERFASVLIQAVGYFALYSVFRYCLTLCQKAMISAARVSVKEEMFHHITGMSRSSFGEQSCGEHIAAFSNDISLLEYRYFSAILDGVDAFVSFITYFSAILMLSNVFAAIVLVFESLGIAICLILKKRNVRLSGRYIGVLSTFTQKVREFFAARQTIHNYAAEDNIRSVFRDVNAQTEQTKTDMEVSVFFTDAFAHFTRCMGAYTIVAVGAVLMMRDAVSFSDVFVAYTFANTLSMPIKKIINDVNAIYSVQSIKVKIERLISQSSEEQALIEPEETFSGISMEHVFVHYDDKMVVSDVTCRFEPGKKYLILGHNGCGKSTLMKLLVRENDNYRGSVIMCGREMRELPNDAVRAHVSFISEAVSVLSDTVCNNITLYRDLSHEQIEQVVTATGLRVPLERSLRDGGRNISSGEKRRIEICRALINQPDVLILDEALSTLDIRTAYEIEKNILDLADKTVICISHNFSGNLLGRYDNIIVMEKGCIIACGPHERLMAECGAYRHLIELKCGRIAQ